MGLPLPRGKRYVYNHNTCIRTSSSLKPPGQSKSNFIGIICMKRGTSMIINKPGHMSKMTAMPIYGKNPSKIFFEGNAEPIATKLDM